MKLLLDECIDRRLAKAFPGHRVRTVPQMGWATVKNGRLLRLAEEEFDVFVTVDRNLAFQHPIPKFRIAAWSFEQQLIALPILSRSRPCFLRRSPLWSPALSES